MRNSKKKKGEKKKKHNLISTIPKQIKKPNQLKKME